MNFFFQPHEHHRIGVIYVGPCQTTEGEIFSNTSGSERYHKFLDVRYSLLLIKIVALMTNWIKNGFII